MRDELVEHTTSLVALLTRGEALRQVAPFRAGASLAALPKKDGGVRPIAVGETLRRPSAKFLCSTHQETARNLLFPLQIGVAQPLGTEVGYQTARQWCERNKNCPSAVFLKADFANAFNTVSRQAFLTQCKQHCPGLLPWVEWCYAEPTNLLFGPTRSPLSQESSKATRLDLSCFRSPSSQFSNSFTHAVRPEVYNSSSLTSMTVASPGMLRLLPRLFSFSEMPPRR